MDYNAPSSSTIRALRRLSHWLSTLQAKLETENTAIEGNFDVAYCLLLHLVFWLIVHDSRDCTPLTVWFIALRKKSVVRHESGHKSGEHVEVIGTSADPVCSNAQGKQH